MRTGMGWVFRELCRWEVGGTSGMVTDDSEIFRLDNLESEVVGGACGARVPKSPVLIQWGRRPPITASARMSTHPQAQRTLKVQGAISPSLNVFML
jgi:hypothetical protein